MQKSEATSQRSETVLVCFALKEEAGAFQGLARDKPDISVLLTRIGKTNAEKSVREFLAVNSPRFVLTCGFAGGLDPQLELGAVVFSTDDAALAGKLLLFGAKPAKFYCASRIAITVSEKQELHRATGADAVEMESEAIQAICRERRIPCATVRVISDPAGEDLPLDFNKLAKPDLSPDYGKLALAVAMSPGKIPALTRLQKNCREGAEKLAAVLEKITERQ